MSNVTLEFVQIFGTRKCQETRKAERYFKERRVGFQAVDLAEKGLSPGELRAVAARLGGIEALIDRDGKRYVNKGLKHSAPTGPRIEQLLLEDPLLLRTPIVRSDAGCTIGYQPEVWGSWLTRSPAK
ncbi:MAG TPA: ArsC/Spx/MgsR family protein [Polyangiaceae bacterium]|nr:ArsC/Spx/MgsR family protein [Polyangiaceae bacterium]